MSDKKRHKAEQRWRYKLDLWVKEQWYRILPGVLALLASLYICWQYLSPEQRATNDHIFLRCYLGVLAFIGVVVLCKPRIITSNPKKYFIARVLATGITGGVFAFLLPVAVKSTTTGVGGLRHSILLATGGLLAILTLGETRRKNDNDKDKNDQDKEKNDKDYQRQVRAERRERYTKAVEQLGDEKAPIRMGGVYTLVGLVDEWLEEENLSEPERLKEGQVIINNLCAYIRSPFTLASHYDELSKANPTPKGIYRGKKEKIYADKATLDSEADIRLGIIKEIHDRLQGSGKNAPGAWSDFEYDFSGSTFFYPIDLTNSYYAKPINFSGSTYECGADFTGSTYKGEAKFTGSTYKGGADFTGSTYRWVNFIGSTYQSWANFSSSTYQSWANFTGSTYRWVNFTGSTYQSWVNFTGSTYQDEADFSGSIFYSDVYFGTYIFNNPSRFTKYAPTFYDETYHQKTLFGSTNNDFTVDTDKGYPINLNFEDLPLGCKFLTSEQKEYLKDKFQEIEETKNKLLEVKDPEEKEELSKKLQALHEELNKWREEVTTVKVEDVAAEDTES